MGWSYANAYFNEWGVPFASLQIPREFIASYGLTAITTQLISFCLYTFLEVLLLILFILLVPTLAVMALVGSYYSTCLLHSSSQEFLADLVEDNRTKRSGFTISDNFQP